MSLLLLFLYSLHVLCKTCLSILSLIFFFIGSHRILFEAEFIASTIRGLRRWLRGLNVRTELQSYTSKPIIQQTIIIVTLSKLSNIEGHSHGTKVPRVEVSSSLSASNQNSMWVNRINSFLNDDDPPFETLAATGTNEDSKINAATERMAQVIAELEVIWNDEDA